ncbi:MAG: phosphatidylglycerophosphate synthase [Legionellales bacterium RIFCSPHIGHO2_12_FULL_42_9]|nr:MAG: phosphatidylglycerophosphate synthase [Legionellales bacterium RIFCSPHIGHO2_12_FULL_42_9]
MSVTVPQRIITFIPNALTLFRLILIGPFLLSFDNQEYVSAFYLFAIAGFSDGLDGWLARCFNWQSPLGSFIDPLADKLLVASSFISLALLEKLPWWLVVIVFMRDLTISTGVVAWYYLIQRKLVFEPTYLSKINTVLQLSLVTLCLFELAFPPFSFHIIPNLIILTTATTTITYTHYVWTWGKKAFATHDLAQ